MEDLAARALELIDGDGLVGVRRPRGDVASVTFVVVREGRAGRAEAAETDDLARAAKTAWLRAGQARAWPVHRLPEAHMGRSITGDDVEEAIAATWGTRTYESRALPAPAAADGGALPGGPCVLAPTAVATVLAALGAAFGVDLALGADPPPATAAVTLVDDAHGVRAFDAEGVPKQRVVLIERGAFVGGVRDSQAGDSTGHATRPLTLAPRAEHLRLAGDGDVGAPDVTALARGGFDARAVLARVEAVGADGSVRLG